ncbi:MAG: adenylate/guanylate cyclase domain-containing protein [Rhodocyclaceae bacterium]|nr:adenylate/guanylate cyclase domain-containing protein [Rhodocyclaceae bacterium]
MKKNFTRFLLGVFCVLAFVGHAGRVWEIPFVSVLDAYLYDARLRLTMPGTVDDRVVIVDLDEKSLAEVGRWPWGRNVLAELVTRLVDDYKVAIVGFDVVFAEPDESSGLRVLEDIGQRQLKGEPAYQKALQGLRSSLNYDQLFADTLRGRPVVLGYYFSNLTNAAKSGALPQPVFAPGSFQGRPEQVVSWKGFGGNLPVLQNAAQSAGHFNPLVDFDGNSRRVPMIVSYGGAYYESLSLAVVRTLIGNTQLQPGYPDQSGGMEWLAVIGGDREIKIPVDDSVAALIPYRGRERSFPYISAVDVLKGRADKAQLDGRIVLVGTTAPGLMDLRATPVGSTYPGVEVHANLVAGILDGSIKERPGYIVGIEALKLILLGGLLAFILPQLSPIRASLLTAVVLITIVGLNFSLWSSANLSLPLASGILLTLLLFALNMSWGYFVESRTKRQFTELFGQYVPPELVDEMARDPQAYSMAGRNVELTVLFSDVRGFTNISEGLDPQELSQLMNEYLGAMTAVIRKNRGTLDKYMGDAIMAFWGAPVADSDHAQHAVLTAIAMQKELKMLAEPFRVRGWPELHIGVGVNTGMMTVGDMGSPVRKAYTVMGDAVNLGSRLESITKQYGVGIIVGPQTRDLLKDQVVFRELDKVRVKGKDEPVAIYEPLGLVDDVSVDALAHLKTWQHALRLYRAQDWEQAELQFYNLSRLAPESKLFQLYLARVAHWQKEPPGADWDGVTTFETK